MGTHAPKVYPSPLFSTPFSRGERRRKEQLLAFNFEPRVLQESPAVGFARRKDVSAGVGEGLDDDDDGDEDSLVTS